MMNNKFAISLSTLLLNSGLTFANNNPTKNLTAVIDENQAKAVIKMVILLKWRKNLSLSI